MTLQKFEYAVLDMIESAARTVKTAPINLGGVGGAGGGVGIPPGGFIGRLAQFYVAYDTLEAATSDTLPSGVTGASGWSLVDNLNHIRYRLNILESGGSIVVENDNTLVDYLDVTSIHFSGAGVVTNDLGGGEVQIVITASGGGGGLDETAADALYLRLDASNDPVTDQLDIVNSTPGNGGIFILTEGDSYTADFERLNSTQSFASSPLIFGYRGISNNNTDNAYLLTMQEATATGGTFSGGAIRFISNSTDRFLYTHNALPAGTVVMFDSDNVINASGKLLSLKNQGNEKFYVTGSGLAYTPEGKLIAEAPIDGVDYVRKDGAWVTLDKCKAARSTAQTISTSTDTRIAFTSEYYDTNTMHDNSTNNTRITIKKAGYYVVSSYVVYAANATGIRSTQIWINGGSSSINTNNAVSAGGHQVGLTDQFLLAVNDYVECNVYHSSGGNLDVNTATLSVVQQA